MGSFQTVMLWGGVKIHCAPPQPTILEIRRKPCFRGPRVLHKYKGIYLHLPLVLPIWEEFSATEMAWQSFETPECNLF